jgi:Ser-tRNA(Ala) deacylase AlaX
MKDFDVVLCTSLVKSVSHTDDNKIDIELDKTCFYPRGGGQDWDSGEITRGNDIFSVEEVRLDENGVVHHIGSFKRGGLKAGDVVDGKVETNRRSINTRLHSAGHVIDMAIDSLGLDWVATKGQHYPQLSAIEYEGTLNPEKTEELRISIEKTVNELISKGTDNSLEFMPVEEMHKVVRHVPNNIPKNKPGRVVMYGDNFGIPCGGTHVKNLSQIGNVHIPKLKGKKGVIRVSYTVEGIN